MQSNRKEYIISITSQDRVGIIHDVASAISYINGDLADMQQQVLRGYFTMILYVSFPEDVSPEEIHKKISAAGTAQAPLEVLIKEVLQPESEQPLLEANRYVLTADGADRIGFVATVTKFCKDNSVNIIDLTTTVSGDRYVMILFVDLSNSESIAEVSESLERFAEATDLNMMLQHNDIFKATNEIKIF
jgi:predicted amino acid-binding ACT domain protein